LHPIVLAVGHEDAVVGNPDAMRQIELAGAIAWLAP
jgi:hypothetical protein